jgi:hypothetical protein
MTDQRPITPPPELVKQWSTQASYYGNTSAAFETITTQAARWGADQELEACIDVIFAHPGLEHPELLVEILRSIRRPQPPSLKEQALEALKHAEEGWRPIPADCDIIRRALEQLDD